MKTKRSTAFKCGIKRLPLELPAMFPNKITYQIVSLYLEHRENDPDAFCRFELVAECPHSWIYKYILYNFHRELNKEEILTLRGILWNKLRPLGLDLRENSDCFDFCLDLNKKSFSKSLIDMLEGMKTQLSLTVNHIENPKMYQTTYVYTHPNVLSPYASIILERAGLA
ncbi:MAG: hypothetical protein JWO00_577 [Candidatus Parcubacteria bacterium]|nr:hypothetical protein [Candidatus Parcubacteria bacterium]